MWKKGSFRLFLVFILWLGIFSSSDAVNYNHQDVIYVEGEVLVKLKSSLHRASLNKVHTAMNARVVHATALGEGELQLVRLPQGVRVEDAIRAYSQNPYVEYAEPNYRVYKAQLIPDDPYFNLQWGLRNTGQNVDGFVGASGVDIKITHVWPYCQGDGVVIAVLDTGVDYNHPDLWQNIWRNPGETCNNGVDDDLNGFVDDCIGWNFAYNNNNPMDDDSDGHGTHVAGIIGAVGNNGQFVAGVGWRVKIMPVKFLDSSGSGSIDGVVRAIRYAVDSGAKIINASYAYPYECYQVSPSNAERDALRYAESRGVLVIAAAGNSGCNNDQFPAYPASYKLSNVISVTANDMLGRRPYWANYGRLSVHLAAPGFRIYSLLPNGRYGPLNGTSMAVPFVSGVAGLLYACKSETDHLRVREILLSSVEPISSFADNTITGGMLNAQRAFSSEPLPVKPSLISQVVQTGGLTLTFQDNSYLEDGFYVRVGSTPGTLQRVANLQSSSGAYSSIRYTLDYQNYGEGNAYRVSLCAYNTYGESCSDAISLILPPRAPTGLTYSFSEGRVILSWRDNSAVEDGYSLERRAEGGSWSEIARLTPNTTSYVDTPPSVGVYYYRIRAYKGNAFSAYSEEVSVRIESTISPQRGGGCSTGGAYGTLTSYLILIMLIALRRRLLKHGHTQKLQAHPPRGG